MGRIVIYYTWILILHDCRKFVSKIFVKPKFITGDFEKIFPDISRTNLDFPGQKGVIVYMYICLKPNPFETLLIMSMV